VSDRERSIVISSLTKTYNMMGFAMGWQVTSPRLVKRLGDLRFMTHYVPPSPSSQHAGLAALTPPLRDEIVSEVTRTFERGAQMTCAALADIEAVNCPMPQGGQFAFCHVGGDDLRFADWLKAEFGLAVVPGVIWGPSGRGFIRLALGNPPDYQERGLAMLREALLSGRSPAAGAGSAS
jgi:aspartate/methionine/tyrosine aminotransferase